MFGRARKSEREAAIRRLYELRREATARYVKGDELAWAARQTYSDFLLYAQIGKDRKKLGMEWVEKAEAQVRDGQQWFAAAFPDRSA